MGLDTTGHGHRCEQGDLILFQDGSGFILGFFEHSIDLETILVGWGDCQRIVSLGDFLVGKKKYLKPEIGKYIGHRFENIEEVRSALASCGKVPLNRIEVTCPTA